MFWAVPLAVSWLGITTTAAAAAHHRGPHVSRPPPDFSPRGDPFYYMVDNTFNTHKTAPDKGTQNGAVWLHSGSFENYMANLNGKGNSNSTAPDFRGAATTNDTSNYLHNVAFGAGGIPFISDNNSSAGAGPPVDGSGNSTSSLKTRSVKSRQGSDYWLPELAPLGSQPLAASGYKLYRDVTAYGAVGDGSHDDTEAINAAIQDGHRCGEDCGSTFTQGAIIYFPPGTYKICRPIIQLYYTQFIGHATNRPTIVGCETFSGIGLIDTDPYIPGGNGAQWFVNQNQFFRQIRNFVFDLTKMPLKTDDNGQPLAPTGLHWQVAQAASLQNLLFKMPTNDGNGTHVGIFMENGSGGFVSDLEFQGGAVGWRAGTQQYTARNLKFTGCTEAVQMIWDWGFNWQQIEVDGGSIAFNISAKGGITAQGVGSISLIDSKFTNVPTGILTYAGTDAPPNMVIDNLVTSNVGAVVKTADGEVLLGASEHVALWAIGPRYIGGQGGYQSGDVYGVPSKPSSLLSDGSLFARSRPQYETLGVGSFLVATAAGIKNDGTGDQTAAINTFLQSAVSQGLVAYFPAGIYQIQGTVFVPVGSKIQGASWSQIQGTGTYFQDMKNPKVMVQVGQPGDKGVLEIVEMLFSVKGPTAGAILMEWNVHESTQGSAAMWDSHFRVGGATGSELAIGDCPKFGYSEKCIAASLLFHITSKASGYFENVWVWTADHDNDMNMYYELDASVNQVSIYTGRGMLIESQGPSWFIGGGSEHSVLYQYQLLNAKDIYLGHIQTESPYYQPDPVGPKPFDAVSNPGFPSDPTIDDCKTDTCRNSWAVRIIDSSDIYIHSAGMYSFFQNYDQDCVGTFDCQDRVIQVRGSHDVAIFNIFTVGSVQVANGAGNQFITQDDTQSGFTTEVSVWVPPLGDDDYEVVYLGSEVYTSYTAQCTAPCIFVLPPSAIPTTTITILSYVTSIQVGSGVGTTTTITVHPTAITTDSMGFSNVNVTSDQNTQFGFVPTKSVPVAPVTVDVTGPDGQPTHRTLSLPPWPAINNGPPLGWPSSAGPWGSNPAGGGVGGGVVSGTLMVPFVTPYSVGFTATGPTTATVTFPSVVSPTTVSCPPSSVFSFNTPATAVTLPCPGVMTIDFTCPTTKVVTITASTITQVTVDCTTIIGVSVPTSDTTSTTTTPLPIWTTWPPGIIAPVTTSVDKPKPTGDHSETPCHLWFFWICISFQDINIKGWSWSLPPGIYPPGPPPLNIFRPPPGWTIKGPLPPWPPITIGSDRVPTFDPNNDNKPCETKSASICSTTTSFVSVVSDGTTQTSTSTSATCATILGCNVEDENSTTDVATCTVERARRKRRDTPQTAVPALATAAAAARVVPRDDTPPDSDSDCDDEFGSDSIIYLRDPKDSVAAQKIRDMLANEFFHEARSEALKFTAFFWVEQLGDNTAAIMKKMDEVAYVYDYEQYNQNNPDPDRSSGRSVSASRRNGTMELVKREDQKSNFWELSEVSTPRKGDWYNDERIRVQNPTTQQTDYSFYYDQSSGAGQYIYVAEDGIWKDHPEFDGALIEHVEGADYGDKDITADLEHGSGVAAKVIGRNLGIVKAATMVVLDKNANENDVANPKTIIKEKILESLLNAADDIARDEGRRKGKSVVSISWGVRSIFVPPEFLDTMLAILKELDALDTPIVTLAHNYARDRSIGPEIIHYPAKFLGEGKFPNLIVVGSTNGNSRRAGSSMESDWMTTYAPGENVNIPAGPSGGYMVDSGTSYATPLVAGLVAYFRALPLPGDWSTQLQKPAAIKALIRNFQRRLIISDPSVPPDESGTTDIKPFIWNGQVFDKSCLLDRPFEGDAVCGDELPADLGTLSANGGESIQGNGDGSAYPDGQGPPSDATGSSITYHPGTPSPTCTTKCGTLCSGYYCQANPTGTPSDFTDPVNLPTPPPIGPTSCDFTTTSTQCNGSGGNTVCVPVEVCTTAPDLPDLPGGPTHTGTCVASGAVTTCAMGPGGQSACVTTSTCTNWATATPKPPPPPPPPPVPENGFIIIALMELLANSEGGFGFGQWVRSWSVLASTLDRPVELCDSSAVFTKSTTAANGASPGFPPTLGPFEAVGFTCTYKGTEDKLGLLVCDGVKNMWCSHMEKQVEGCGIVYNPTMTTVVLCQW